MENRPLRNAALHWRIFTTSELLASEFPPPQSVGSIRAGTVQQLINIQLDWIAVVPPTLQPLLLPQQVYTMEILRESALVTS